MTTKIQPLPDRLAELERITLLSGAHDSPEEGMCAMEAAAYIAGEDHSDSPQCTSPAIAAFLRSWNDALSDPPRTDLIRPLLPHVIGTRTTDEDEEARAWMATDWLIRVCAPAFLELSPSLREHARTLAGLPPVTDARSAESAQRDVDAAGVAAGAATWAAARGAARAAARVAAGAAAWAAARGAARGAAGDAARAAAWDAAWAAARGAARAAAGDAAWAAAWAAAGAAAGAALAPTVERLQQSAAQLVMRMCEVGRAPVTGRGGGQ